MKQIIERLCAERRDLISQGYDNALYYLADLVPEMQIHEYPTGTEAWSWIIPPKWEVRDAYVIAPHCKALINLENHGLHVMSYSRSVDKVVSHGELMAHLRTDPNAPDAIPFHFSYYKPDWAFCVEHNRLQEFTHDEYHVYIDSAHMRGELKVGEVFLPGAERDEIVLIAHLCHPYQANDNASGCAVLCALADRLRNTYHKLSYRIILCPETVGSIAYLAHNEHLLQHMKYGIAVDMLGNDNRLILQRTPKGDTQIDKAAELYIQESAPYRAVVSNDEKVLNAVGVKVPCISITRAEQWGAEGKIPYYGYHTSHDSPERIHSELLEQALQTIEQILKALNESYRPVSKVRGPIMLSRHGLWIDHAQDRELSLKQSEALDMLDGEHTVIDIAHSLGLDFDVLAGWLERFRQGGLIDEV